MASGSWSPNKAQSVAEGKSSMKCELPKGRGILSKTILDYCHKYGQNRDLEKYLRFRHSHGNSSTGSSGLVSGPDSDGKDSRTLETLSILKGSGTEKRDCEVDNTSEIDLSSKKSPKNPVEMQPTTSGLKASQKSGKSLATKIQSKKSDSKKKSLNINMESNIVISVSPPADVSNTKSQFDEINTVNPSAVPADKTPDKIDAGTDAFRSTSAASSLASAKNPLEWDSMADVGYVKSSDSKQDLTSLERQHLRNFFADRGLKVDNNFVVIASKNRLESESERKAESAPENSTSDNEKKPLVEDILKRASTSGDIKSPVKETKKQWQKALEKYREKYRNLSAISCVTEFSISDPAVHSTPNAPLTVAVSTMTDLQKTVADEENKEKVNFEKYSQTSLVGKESKEIQVYFSLAKANFDDGTMKSSKSSDRQMETARSIDDKGQQSPASSFEFVLPSKYEQQKQDNQSRSETDSDDEIDEDESDKENISPIVTPITKNTFDSIDIESNKENIRPFERLAAGSSTNQSESRKKPDKTNEYSLVDKKAQDSIDRLDDLLKTDQIDRKTKKAMIRKVVLELLKAKTSLRSRTDTAPKFNQSSGSIIAKSMEKLLLTTSSSSASGIQESRNEKANELPGVSSSQTQPDVSSEGLSGVRPLSSTAKSSTTQTSTSSSEPLQTARYDPRTMVDWLQPMTHSELDFEHHQQLLQYQPNDKVDVRQKEQVPILIREQIRSEVQESRPKMIPGVVKNEVVERKRNLVDDRKVVSIEKPNQKRQYPSDDGKIRKYSYPSDVAKEREMKTIDLTPEEYDKILRDRQARDHRTGVVDEKPKRQTVAKAQKRHEIDKRPEEKIRKYSYPTEVVDRKERVREPTIIKYPSDKTDKRENKEGKRQSREDQFDDNETKRKSRHYSPSNVIGLKQRERSLQSFKYSYPSDDPSANLKIRQSDQKKYSTDDIDVRTDRRRKDELQRYSSDDRDVRHTRYIFPSEEFDITELNRKSRQYSSFNVDHGRRERPQQSRYTSDDAKVRQRRAVYPSDDDNIRRKSAGLSKYSSDDIDLKQRERSVRSIKHSYPSDDIEKRLKERKHYPSVNLEFRQSDQKKYSTDDIDVHKDRRSKDQLQRYSSDDIGVRQTRYNFPSEEFDIITAKEDNRNEEKFRSRQTKDSLTSDETDERKKHQRRRSYKYSSSYDDSDKKLKSRQSKDSLSSDETDERKKDERGRSRKYSVSYDKNDARKKDKKQESVKYIYPTDKFDVRQKKRVDYPSSETPIYLKKSTESSETYQSENTDYSTLERIETEIERLERAKEKIMQRKKMSKEKRSSLSADVLYENMFMFKKNPPSTPSHIDKSPTKPSLPQEYNESKDRTKLETPNTDDDINQYAREKRKQFIEHYDASRGKLYPSRTSSAGPDLERDRRIYTQPHSSGHYSEPQSQSSRNRQNRYIRTNDAYTSMNSTDLFLSSRSVSIPDDKYTCTTTHQYDNRPSIAIQTTDSIVRSKPIFEAIPPKQPCRLLRPFPKENYCRCSIQCNCGRPKWHTKRIDHTKNNKNLQITPEAMGWIVSFPYQKEKAEMKIRKIDSAESGSSTDSELLPLCDRLKKSRPEFVARADDRRKWLNEVHNYRLKQNAQRNHLLRHTSTSALRTTLNAAAQQRHVPTTMFISKIFRAETKRKYQQLAEVQNKADIIRKNKNQKNNFLLRDIYKKNLQQRVLAGALNVSNSETLLPM